MSDRFSAVSGRNVVSRTTAEELGSVTHVAVDVKRRQVASLVVGKGRKAAMIDYDQVSGFGPDAIMVADESALHEPRDDHEREVAKGTFELIGKRTLSDTGNDLGTVTDVVFDPDTGAIESILIGGRPAPPGSLLGAGSFAVVVLEPAGSGELADSRRDEP